MRCVVVCRPKILLAAPANGWVAGAGVGFFGCPPATSSSPKLVHLFPYYLQGRTASPEVTCPLRPAPPAKHTCFHSSCERRGRRSWRPLLLLSFGEAFLTGVGASIPSISSGDARLRRRSAALCGRILRPSILAFAPPVNDGVAGVDAVFIRCLPVKPSLQELVHLFPALAPGTHGFAGGNLPLVAGSSYEGRFV